MVGFHTSSRSVSDLAVRGRWLRSKRRKASVFRFLAILAVGSIISVGFGISCVSPTTGTQSDQLLLTRPLTIRWQFDSDETTNLSSATDGIRVYAPLVNGKIVSLRADSGLLLWTAEIGGEISASLVADQQMVFVPSEIKAGAAGELRDRGAIRAIGKDSGVTTWLQSIESPVRGGLSQTSTLLLAGSEDGRIHALRKDSGKTVWTTGLGSPVSSHLTIAGELLLVGTANGRLVAIEHSSGKLKWDYRTRGAVHGRPGISSGFVYFGSADGNAYAIDAGTGKLIWKKRTGAGVESVAVGEREVLISSLDNFVYGLSLPRGRKLWKRKLAGRPTAEPLTVRGATLFTPLSGDSGIVLDPRDGRVLNTLPVGEDNNTAASPMVVGDLVVLTTRKGVFAFGNPRPSANRR